MDRSYMIQWPSKMTGITKPCYFVEELLKQGVEDHVIETVLKTLDRTCKHCWDAPAGCYCWNDD